MKTTRTILALATLLTLVSTFAAVQRPGGVDLSFDPGQIDGNRPWETGVSIVEDVILLPDGRIYVGGHINTVQGEPRDAIARLLPNGKIDPTFLGHSDEFSLRGDIHRFFLLPDGKLIVFGFHDGTRRFNSDGTGDAAFESTSHVLALLPEGKLLAIPNLLQSDTRKLIRLNADGSRDPSFEATIEFGGVDRPVLVEPDGRIVLPASSAGASHLVRLMPDGKLDPTFSSRGLNVGLALARQPDGRYLAVGNDRPVFRLNTDGTLDSTFSVPANLFLGFEVTSTGVWGDYIFDLAVQPDGKILVAGEFSHPRSISKGGRMRAVRSSMSAG